MHGNNLLLIHSLLNTLDLLNLKSKVSKRPLYQTQIGKRGRTYIVHKHRLNTILQRNSAGIAGATSTTQLQHNNTILKAFQFDITTIFLDSRTDASLEQFLDHADNLIIILVIRERVLATLLLAVNGTLDCRHDGLARCHGLSNDAEDFRLDVRPVRVAAFRHCDEVCAVEDGCDTFNIEQFRRERGWVWWRKG